MLVFVFVSPAEEGFVSVLCVGGWTPNVELGRTSVSSRTSSQKVYYLKLLHYMAVDSESPGFLFHACSNVINCSKRLYEHGDFTNAIEQRRSLLFLSF